MLRYYGVSRLSDNIHTELYIHELSLYIIFHKFKTMLDVYLSGLVIYFQVYLYQPLCYYTVLRKYYRGFVFVFERERDSVCVSVCV